MYPFSPQMRRKSGWKWMYKTGGYQADMNGQRLAVILWSVYLQLRDVATGGWYVVFPAFCEAYVYFFENRICC